MKLSVEILDYIFSFLVSERTTLIACSRDPVLSQIVERHLYHTITVYFDTLELGREHSDANFGPDRLSRFISENPQILYHVRILRIQVVLKYMRNLWDPKMMLDQFAPTLLMFPVLECIQLISPANVAYHWPDAFRSALEDRLGLPTVKEVHMVGWQGPPCPLIDNRKNIEHLLLSGSYPQIEHRPCVSTCPQLKSLTLLDSLHESVLAMVKPHIKGLRSLKCASSAVDDLPELLEVCSQTLNNLDIGLLATEYYTTNYIFRMGQNISNSPSPEVSPVPPKLQQLTIRAEVQFRFDEHRRPKIIRSHLPAAAKIINLFVSSLQHLTLDIHIHLFRKSTLAKVDFSPLAVLEAASQSIPRIDLYIHTGVLPSSVTLAQFLSSLADSVNISRSIEEGSVVVHSEEIAPGIF